jgi:hypothetical protein
MSEAEKNNIFYVIHVTKARSLNKIALPCRRLERRLLEILVKGQLPSNEYEFTIYEANIPTDEGKPRLCSIETYANSTIYFTIGILINGSEYFEVSLKVPVQYRDDNLVVNLKKAEKTINNQGWCEDSLLTKSILRKNSNQKSNADLIDEMNKWLEASEREIRGINNEIRIKEESILAILKTQGLIYNYLKILKSSKNLDIKA